MKWFLISMLVWSYFYPGFGSAYCSEVYSLDDLPEKYYIENQYVLLYKIINWWYVCPPDDDFLLCGKAIRCNNLGKADVNYAHYKYTESAPDTMTNLVR